ncbi:hypothetical protein BCV70DRAFT_203955 [Testicularia cyperi]|uniref:Uncharacterized protein n=1 Tax=Testicularia cyperi TaxID=1882483 RepID=A0A317XXU9_9BASI|nr:hypothetical protein BCV70DRAFT_203955 [Testicularia cyperi]
MAWRWEPVVVEVCKSRQGRKRPERLVLYGTVLSSMCRAALEQGHNEYGHKTELQELAGCFEYRRNDARSLTVEQRDSLTCLSAQSQWCGTSTELKPRVLQDDLGAGERNST